MSRSGRRNRKAARNGGWVESLEERKLLSLSTFPALTFSQLKHRNSLPAGSHPSITFPLDKPTEMLVKNHPASSTPSANWLTPSQMTNLYGVNLVEFGTIQGTGAGQTIAIIDAYNNPGAAADLTQFDNFFSLPAPPSFKVLNEFGSSSSLPQNAPGQGNSWAVEESLDVQWSHVIAPQANIILIEANSASNVDLLSTAVNTARSLAGVSVISMSFGSGESSNETGMDSLFTTPAGHPGVTFVASTGDTGAPGGYPAFSPNVLAVGGTQFNSTTSYQGETGWSSGGGGISVYESQPAYQNGVVTQSSTQRTIPDVSMDANTPVAIYDSYDFGGGSPWGGVIGTSLAAPMWAGIIAIADQGRKLANLPSLDGATQTLPAIYALPQSDFNDVTSGGNGNGQFAGPGYDLVTGRGTPIPSLLIPDLAGVGSISGNVFQDNLSNGINSGTDVNLPGTTVYIDSNNNGMLDAPTNTMANGTGLPLSIPDHNNTGVSSSATIAGTIAPITNVSVTLNITHSRDSNLQAFLFGPDGTEVTLFLNIGGSNANFSNTTLSGTATNSIASGSAPFNGTFAPSVGSLTVFNGKIGSAVNGKWTLKVADTVTNRTGTFNSWSITVTTGETSTTTDSNGNFTFNSVALGSYNIRQIIPTGEVQIAPGPSGQPPAANVVAVNNRVITGQNFSDFPDVFSTTAISANEYLMLDPTGTNLEIFNSSSPGATPDYQVPEADLPSLTFNMNGAGDSLFVDYTNGPILLGNPLSPGSITLAGSSDNLELLGQSPAQIFSMTDTQIGPSGGSQILYQGVQTLTVLNCTADYTGSFTGFQTLDIGPTASLNWM